RNRSLLGENRWRSYRRLVKNKNRIRLTLTFAKFDSLFTLCFRLSYLNIDRIGIARIDRLIGNMNVRLVYAPRQNLMCLSALRKLLRKFGVAGPEITAFVTGILAAIYFANRSATERHFAGRNRSTADDATA